MHFKPIIAPFNATWFCFLAVLGVLIFLFSLVLTPWSEARRRKLLAILGLFTVIYLFVYKYLLFRDPGFPFEAWNELPLQPCNLVAILLIPAALTGRRLLSGFCFYIGSLSALVALIMPVEGFSNIELFSVRAVGFYGFHALVLILAISLGTLGLYRPRYGDILPVLCITALLAAALHGVNLLLRATVYPGANYFFTCDLPPNALLDKLEQLVPVPLLFVLPLLLPMAVWSLLLTWLSGLRPPNRASPHLPT